MLLLLLLPRSSDNAFYKCFLPACRFSLQCHTIRALFFFSSQIRLLCPHLKSASKSVFASSKVTSMFFSCSLNQSLSQLSTRPGPRFTPCIQCPIVTTTCRKDWTALFIKALWHMPVYSCVWYVCVYDMYVTALVLRSKDNLQGLALSSTFWGLGTELRLFPWEASVCARWAISGS